MKLCMSSIQVYLKNNGWEMLLRGAEADCWWHEKSGRIISLDVESSQEWYAELVEIIANTEGRNLADVKAEIEAYCP